MREQSVYVVECAKCSATIECHEAEGNCGKCGVAFRVERGGDSDASH